MIDPWLVASSLGCFSASVIVATHHDKTSPMFLWDYRVWEMARFEVQITVLSHVPHIKLSCCYLSLTECYSTVKMEYIGSVILIYRNVIPCRMFKNYIQFCHEKLTDKT